MTGGAREISGAYDLFAPGPHAELLVDRQGYLRARWTSPPDLGQLLPTWIDSTPSRWSLHTPTSTRTDH
jgi:hypothetical protein